MLNSPADDFATTTLSAVSGTFGKLLYVSGLRQGNGKYFHWGMMQRHGEANANLAIGQAHASIFLSLLRSPIRGLWEEVDGAAAERGMDVRELIGELLEKGDQLLPKRVHDGGRRHFNSVLLALCCLAEVQGPRTGRAA